MTPRPLAFCLLGIVTPLHVLIARATSTLPSRPLKSIPVFSPSNTATVVPLKVLIAGAGIAGPAAAFWLSRIGCEVTIMERSPKLRATGQQVDLLGQGITIMKMMGIEDAVWAV